LTVTRRICTLAIMSALVTVCKIAIPIPNVEIVTALLVSYALVLRLRDVMVVVFVFIALEIAIWGFAWWWVVSYVLYWPLLVLTVYLIYRLKLISRVDINKYKIVCAIVVGILFSMLFGVLSSFVEVIVLNGISSGNFWLLFRIRYTIGFPFFVTNVISNIVVLPLLVPLFYVFLTRQLGIRR